MILKSEYHLEIDADGSSTEFNGKGYKLGVGYEPSLLFIPLPFSINLEYAMTTIEEVDHFSGANDGSITFPVLSGSNLLTRYEEPEVTTLFLTVSMPFAF